MSLKKPSLPISPTRRFSALPRFSLIGYRDNLIGHFLPRSHLHYPPQSTSLDLTTLDNNNTDQRTSCIEFKYYDAFPNGRPWHTPTFPKAPSVPFDIPSTAVLGLQLSDLIRRNFSPHEKAPILQPAVLSVITEKITASRSGSRHTYAR